MRDGPGSATRAGTAPRSASSSAPTRSWRRSPTTSCTTVTSTPPCAACSSRASTPPTASTSRACGRSWSGCASSAGRCSSNHDLGGVYDEIADELREVVDQERASLQEMARDAAESGEPAAPGGDRRGRPAAPDGPRPPAAGPRRPGEGAAGVRVHLLGGPGEVRGAARPAARAAHAALRGPGVGLDAVDVARGHGPDEGHAGRAQHDARAAGPGRGARLRRVHGALRRLLPGEPPEPRRAAGAHGPAHGRHAGDAQLDDARAAGAAPEPVRPAPRGHGPAVAGGPARPEPAGRLPGPELEPELRLLRPGPDGLRRGGRR